MFNREELLIFGKALSTMDIKGSDAMYIATLLSKINSEVNKIDEKAEKAKIEKEEKLKKITKTK